MLTGMLKMFLEVEWGAYYISICDVRSVHIQIWIYVFNVFIHMYTWYLKNRENWELSGCHCLVPNQDYCRVFLIISLGHASVQINGWSIEEYVIPISAAFPYPPSHKLVTPLNQAPKMITDSMSCDSEENLDWVTTLWRKKLITNSICILFQLEFFFFHHSTARSSITPTWTRVLLHAQAQYILIPICKCNRRQSTSPLSHSNLRLASFHSFIHSFIHSNCWCVQPKSDERSLSRSLWQKAVACN